MLRGDTLLYLGHMTLSVSQRPNYTKFDKQMNSKEFFDNPFLKPGLPLQGHQLNTVYKTFIPWVRLYLPVTGTRSTVHCVLFILHTYNILQF